MGGQGAGQGHDRRVLIAAAAAAAAAGGCDGWDGSSDLVEHLAQAADGVRVGAGACAASEDASGAKHGCRLVLPLLMGLRLLLLLLWALSGTACVCGSRSSDAVSSREAATRGVAAAAAHACMDST